MLWFIPYIQGFLLKGKQIPNSQLLVEKEKNYSELKKTSRFEVERLDIFSMKGNQTMYFRFSDSRWSDIVYSTVPLIVLAGSDVAKGFSLLFCSSPGTIWVGQRLWMCCACIGADDQQDSSEPVKGLPTVWLEKAAAKKLQARKDEFLNWNSESFPSLALILAVKKLKSFGHSILHK